MREDRKDRWDKVYAEKPEAQLSWHQDTPSVSLELMELVGLTPETRIIDVAGGSKEYTSSDCREVWRQGRIRV